MSENVRRPRRLAPYHINICAARTSRDGFAWSQADSADEAYAAKAMPDLGLEIEDFQAQTWRIENWSKQGKRLTGPEFSCGGHKWYVLLPAITVSD